MRNVEPKNRSRTQSTASDPRKPQPKWNNFSKNDNPPSSPTSMEKREMPSSPLSNEMAVGSGEEPAKEPERKKSGTGKRRHPAEQKKAVMMALMEPESRDDRKRREKFLKGPSMIRRFSRAASFKRARQHLPLLNLTELMRQFEKHSTIHGICHAGLAPNKKWRHFWLGVFAVCFTIMIVQLIYLIVKFFQYPKTVDLDLKFELTEFPSVTICNLNPYKASALERDRSAKATIDAMETALHDSEKEEATGGRNRTNSAEKRRERREVVELADRQRLEEMASGGDQPNARRYLQVYAQCYCEVNRRSSVRKQGSCYAAHKNRVSLTFMQGHSEMHYFFPSKCLCQLDWNAKAIWPCFPYNTWKEHICTECVDLAGHCPMRFLNYRTVNGRGGQPNKTSKIHAIETLDEGLDVCVCHKEYNHCVQNNNRNGEIPELLPSDDLDALNLTRYIIEERRSFGRAGIPPAVRIALRKEEDKMVQEEEKKAQKEALGFKELKDEIAIKSQARENLIYAMGEKTEEERVELSHLMHEMILKCSFNQQDCDIQKDFKLFHDPTYGNCYTFNWDRNAKVTAHRAGANFGLRVMVYANVSEYLPTTEAIGFRITVHDKWTVPFVDAFGYNAPTGIFSAYGVRMKKFFRLEHPYGHCRASGDRELPNWYIYPGYNYSVEGCHRSCSQQEVARVCGCADPMFPVPSGVTRCAMQDQKARDCIKNTSSQLSAMVEDEQFESCHCPLPCYETAYELTYSAARWPSGTAKLMECESTDELCMEKYRINAALVQVFYEEFNYQTLTESAAYSLTSLFADLGGLTGLWIGISLVSILEVVQLIWFCMKYIHKKKRPELLAMVRSARSRKSSLSNGSEETVPEKKQSRSSKAPSSSDGIRPRTSSAGGKSMKSLRSVISSTVGPAGMRIISEEVQSGSTRSNTPYLPPEVDLPCTCLYGARGQIVFMKPLCPFHGYMVRRGMRRKSSSSRSEEEDSGDIDEEQGPFLTAEEAEALQKEMENEGRGTRGRVDGARQPTVEEEEEQLPMEQYSSTSSETTTTRIK